MKELNQITTAWKQQCKDGLPCALATVVWVEGSSYRRVGARMLIQENGRWLGGISGGCLEGDVLRKAKMAMYQGKPQRVIYDTSGKAGRAIGASLGCDGKIEILITPLEAENSRNPLQLLVDGASERSPLVMLSLLKSSLPGLETGNAWMFTGTIPVDLKQLPQARLLEEEVQRVLEQGQSQLVDLDDQTQVFLEFIPPRRELYLFGGNYDTIPLLNLAREIGWGTTVVTDPNRAQLKSWQQADRHIVPESPDIALDAWTAVVLMAHDYEIDKANLRTLVDAEIGYIGLLGPRKRTERMLRELGEEGCEVSADKGRIFHGPAGLDIGAATPHEIALSILAEINAVFARRSGQPLYLSKEPIHPRNHVD